MSFKSELSNLINMHSLEQYSNTPDFVLAKFLQDCLRAYEFAVEERDRLADNKKDLPAFLNVEDKSDL